MEANMAVFGNGTTFTGTSTYPGGNQGAVTVSFSLSNEDNPANRVSPVDIANAISAVIQAQGYPRLVVKGSPVPEPLNP
ncbi:hypothetical protein ACWDR0_25425 [Streptomyces sp. NPDC003691]